MERYHNGESLGAVLPSPQLWFVPLVPRAPGALPSQLSAQERGWGEPLPAPRRQQYWCSRAVMRQLLSGVLGCTPLQLPLHSPPGEPPQLEPGHGSVSLSHTSGALLIGWSPLPIGVDLELLDRRFDALALMRRFFPAAEQQQLLAMASHQLNAAVLRSWLAKEAAIKWRQRTIAGELAQWTFDHHSGLLRHCSDGLKLQPLEGAVESCCWAVVGEGLEQGQLIPQTWPFECG